MVRKVVAIDVGGTFLKAAAVSENGQIMARENWPTVVGNGTTAMLNQIADIARMTAKKAGWQWEGIAGVGLGVAGFHDFEQNFCEESINLGWKNVWIVKEMEERLQVPICFDNDANAAAMGEAWMGSGKGYRHILFITLGTGVGGGLVIDGNIYHGVNGMAGEIGHLVLEPDNGQRCNCGQFGCLETISSANGILRAARQRIQQEETSLRNVDNLTAKDVFQHARLGDRVAGEVIDNAIHKLGFALALASNIVNPEMIIIGGGPSAAGEILFKPLGTYFKKYALKRVARVVKIQPAQLGNDAGVLGAAKLMLLTLK